VGAKLLIIIHLNDFIINYWFHYFSRY